MTRRPPSPRHVDLLDTLQGYGAGQHFGDGAQKSPNWFALADEILPDIREDLDLAPRELAIAFTATSPENEGQGNWKRALKSRGIAVQDTHYRDSAVSMSPGIPEADRPQRPLYSLSSRITYTLGLLAERSSPHIIVVSGAFELAGPLNDFVERNGGKAVVAFFRTLLDPRWLRNGLLDAGSNILFADLEPYAKRILGVDLPTRSPDRRVISDDASFPV